MQEIIHTENLDYLQSQPDNHFDFAVLDPPYGLGKITSIENLLTEWLSGGTGLNHQTNGFMNKEWDVLPAPVFWKELLRTVKPGGHIAVFAGSRTQDLMGLSMRLGGWDLRNTLAWIYATGFPHGLNVSKALDAKQGATREVISTSANFVLPKLADGKKAFGDFAGEWDITAPATELAKVYDGYGTDLKPAYEPIILARKPFNSAVAENVEKWGTGGLNLAACKVGNEVRINPAAANKPGGHAYRLSVTGMPDAVATEAEGRFPPNLLFSHSLWCVEGAGCAPDCPVAALDEQSGVIVSSNKIRRDKASSNRAMSGRNYDHVSHGHDDIGAASKFYPNFHFSDDDLHFIFRFIAKASPGERNKGLSDLPKIRKVYNGKSSASSPDMKGVEQKMTTDAQNIHPTVKPVAIMRWLCELLAPPTLNGVVPIGLDPFVGSGTTALAAYSLGLRFVGLEQDANYFEIAQKRLDAARLQLRLEDYLQQLDNAAGLAELGGICEQHG